MYCEYGGLKYKIKKKNNKYINYYIIYYTKQNIFIILSQQLFFNYLCRDSKRITPTNQANEVDIIYNEDVFIKYKDKYFQLFADEISKTAVLDDSYMIWTSSEQLAQEYAFEKKEQFVFIKYITRKEIGAVKIMKTPVLDFKDIEQSEEIIEGDALDSWLSELI